MTTATLSAPLIDKKFPEGTADTDTTFTVTGTLTDGTPFSASQTSGTFDLQPGTYTGVVSKLGESSLPSVSLTIAEPVTVTLSVPDATQAATLV